VAKSRQRSVLTNLELRIMRAIWDGESSTLTVREVVDRLREQEPKKPLAYNTVQTMLTILRDKGAVAQEAGKGRAHRFRARLTRDQVTNSMVDDLVERLFDGEVHPLLVQLVGQESLSRDELERLRGLIDSQLSEEDGA
jgi:BlaI family penicillinase repressor